MRNRHATLPTPRGLRRGIATFAWAVLLGLATALAPAWASVDTATRQQVGTLLKREGLTGATWMLLTPEHGAAIDAAGLRRADDAWPVAPRDRFQVGSIAKPVLAAGVLRLVTQGRVRLDTPVAQLLPELVLDNPWQRTHPVRLRHLLDHTAGLEDAGFRHVFSATATPDAPLREVFARDAMRVAVRTRPGSEYSYSNLGYVLVAMVIERVAGQRYEPYLDTALLQPLGMVSSSFAYTPAGPAADTVGVVTGHVDGAVPQPGRPTRLRPAGQFLTTAADMGAFARFLLGNGEVGGETFIDPRLLRQMGRARGTVAADAGLEAGYALGLWRRDRHGVVGLCHEGSTVGFRAMLCLYPREHKAFFIAFNMDSETADYGAFDALMIRQLGLAPAVAEASAGDHGDTTAWQGWYARMPGKVRAFQYLDLVFNPVRIGAGAGDGLALQPLFAPPVALAPVGGRRYRAADRVDASHVLLDGRDGPEWSNGFSTYRKVPRWRLVAYWINVALGLAGMLYVLVVGGWRLLRRTRAFPADPLAPAWLAIVAMALALALVGASWHRMGDLTVASGLLALATAALPVAAAWGLWRLATRMRSKPPRARHWDAWPLLAVLQWCLVLAAWGMLPLRTWA